MRDTELIPAFATYWARELGVNPKSLVKLTGGINNRVYRCGDRDQKWVIKGYATAKERKTDRMEAEKQFLEFASKAVPGLTPSLIHADNKRRCVVLEYIEGEKFAEGISPDSEDVESARRFIQLLNSAPRIAQRTIRHNAAEGFLSLSEHLANVQTRLEAMSCDHLSSSLKGDAKQLIQNLIKRYAEVRMATNKFISNGLVSDRIGTDQRCISPGDFGFHNAIKTKTGICFFDFEFSGWDDPAKTTVDFILQPRVPVLGLGSPLMNAWRPEHQETVKRRCNYLEPILRLKWSCIMVTVLNPSRLKQIILINPEAEDDLFIQRRMERAWALLASFEDIA